MIDKKKFTKAALNKNVEIFVMYMTFIDLSSMLIHPAKKTQIASLITKKVKISAKYSDFNNVFLKKKTLVLPKIIKLNQHAIELQKG